MLLKKLFYSPSYKIIRFSSTKVDTSTLPAFKEEKIKIRNFEINYLKAGRGPHHVFCMPGVFGTIWSNFKKQIEGFDLSKFSLVIWDPPGSGKSIALYNDQTLDQFHRDADIAYEFMKALKIPRYSILGWSNGGSVGLILASQHQHMIKKLVVWGCSTFMFPHELKYYYTMRDLNTWSKRTKEELIQMYGEEDFRKKIEDLISKMEVISKSKGVCSSVTNIKIPTFLLYGAKDPVVHSSHLNYMHNLIKNSRTYLYPDGGHSIHIQYADDFNKRVQDFLLEPNEDNDVN